MTASKPLFRLIPGWHYQNKETSMMMSFLQEVFLRFWEIVIDLFEGMSIVDP